MVKILAVVALLGTVSGNFEIDASRISVMRVLAQEHEKLLGKTLEEKVVGYGTSTKNGEPFFYVTIEKTVEVRLPGGKSPVNFRETILVDRNRTCVLTNSVGHHPRVELIRSLMILEKDGDSTKVSIRTTAYINGTRQLFTNIGVRVKNKRIEETLRLNLE